MDLNLQPRAANCAVSGQPFAEGDRVASVLARGAGGAVVRLDAQVARAAELALPGPVVCRWVQVHRPAGRDPHPDRTLKLTAETLFLTLSDPATLPTPETDRLVRFLALLLERKRLLRPRGPAPTPGRELYEHARTKQLHEVPAIELTPEFFVAVQAQLSVLVGEPKAAPPPVPAAAS